ncbi:hypothetical protein EVAR_31550_1 [Eumeta japonica]|uniref:Uncharacterized protein n=1 Tax=Eumeta variegata TaxID=151549 RepID=A0A4C1V775_EUMVA|nr:hypothetical protein EVAR_31550_1 [Eumeta japonica]
MRIGSSSRARRPRPPPARPGGAGRLHSLRKSVVISGIPYLSQPLTHSIAGKRTCELPEYTSSSLPMDIHVSGGVTSKLPTSWVEIQIRNRCLMQEGVG